MSGTPVKALIAGVVRTPRGDVKLFGPITADQNLPELLSRVAQTPPGEAYFFYPYDAMLPFLTGKAAVSKYDLFAPGYTTPAQYEEACRSAMRDASWLVVDRYWTNYDSWKAGFPSMPDAEPQETVRFEKAIDSAFEPESVRRNVSAATPSHRRHRFRMRRHRRMIAFNKLRLPCSSGAAPRRAKSNGVDTELRGCGNTDLNRRQPEQGN